MGKTPRPIPIDVKKRVLHEAGYRCANPACRGIITLDIHHLEHVSAGDVNAADDLLPLCPTCHALHEAKRIPKESLRAWKMLLVSLNEGFDRPSVDLLLALDKLRNQAGEMYFSSDAVLSEAASLIASDLISAKANLYGRFSLHLTEKGKHLLRAWKTGDQTAAVHPPVRPDDNPAASPRR